MTGYCSNCHKVWTSEERQGICRWCSRNANCVTTPTKPRQLKSSRRRSHRQVDDGNNGYDHLPEPYLTYYKIALRFGHKALLDEQDDLLQDIIEGLARVAKDRTLSEAAMYRIAAHIKDHYWYKHYAYHNGLDCQHCSKVQRAKCRTAWAYSDWAYYDCHRAVTLESMNKPIIDSEGNITELAELIADDNALDLAEWLDAKTFLIGAPIRLKAIARKRSKGDTLTHAERQYLTKLRKRYQLTLSGG